MKNKILLSLTIFLFSFSTSKGQQEYMVGTSRVSTEPDSTLFSVALSGYGYPAEGRFSINWVFCGTAPANIAAITSLNGKFIAADSNRTLWSGTPLGSNISWKKIGLADGIKVLAGMNGGVYAVNDKGELLMRKTVLRSDVWKRIAEAVDINTLAVLDGKLYATNKKNELMKMKPLLYKKYWTNIGSGYDVRSMTGYGERLFAINAGDTLWHIQPYKRGVPWTEIGRNNGITFDIHIKQIVVLNNRLYAMSNDNKLYIGQHSTDGNLSATAFAIKRNGKTVVLVGVDLTGFDYSLTDDVKEIVSKARKIPKSAILINASHTHFSPSAQAYPAWVDFLVHPDSLYLNNILKKAMVSAIENAMDNMSPADLYFGRGTTDIGKNRSAKDPEFPHDKTLDVLEAKDNKGKIAGILFLTGCHVVFSSEGREGYTISANFPGITRDMIREKTGTDAIFIQGCAGDINPRSTDHKETGRQLATDVFKVLNENMTKITGDISYSFNTLNMPVQPTLPAKLDTSDIPVDPINMSTTPLNIDLIRQLKIDNAQNTADIYARRNVKWADMMLNMYKNGTLPDKVPEYIQIINIGGWKLVGLSREVVTEYGPAIRDIWPVKNVSVAGYCNDVSSYLPNKWHVNNHHYEGYDSFFWYGQPGVLSENVFDVIINGIKLLEH
jgi:hypothetical protein